MRRISSRGTFFLKRLFPFLWFGALALFAATSFPTMISQGTFRMKFPIILLVIAVFSYLIMRKLLFDLVDEVWDAGDTLLIRNKHREERIPLSEITHVSYSSFTSPPRVTITLRHPCSLGKEVVFAPPTSLFAIAKSAIVTELNQRIEASRKD